MGELAPMTASAVSSSRTLPSIPCGPVQFTPPDIARRAMARWTGLKADSVELVRRDPFEYRLNAPCHLLIMAETVERDDGETYVGGLPTSRLRKSSGRLSFIPRGHPFRGWAKPRVLTRCTFFYIDPSGPLLDPELGFAETDLKPRLHFYDRDLWTIASKLKAQIDHPGPAQYVESLIILLGHELLRLNSGLDADGTDAADEKPYMRGGLAGWQRNRILDFVEEHLAEPVPLSALAEVVRLSPFHFSRAFKQTFGMPPHRYLTSRRIERAKTMLADEDLSITQIGMAVGFGETSSFTNAFRKHTGRPPTVYRRSLD